MLLRSGWKMHKTRDRLRANSWVGGRPRTWKPGTGPAADDNLIREGGSFRRDQSEMLPELRVTHRCAAKTRAARSKLE
jgi:hypothetical protein